MRRCLIFLLGLSILFSLIACVAEAPDLTASTNFFYRRVEPDYDAVDGMIASERRNILGVEDNLKAMLQLYFDGPQDAALISPFPKNLTVSHIWQQDTGILLDLSPELQTMSGIDLTLACACISMTCFDLTEAETVSLRVPGQLLNGQPILSMSRANLLLYDNSLEQLQQPVTLYYTDSERRFLVSHDVAISQGSLADTCVQMVSLLLKPPEGLISPLPAGTKVLDASIRSGVCTINLSSEFETNAFSEQTAQRITLLSIVNTLTQLDGVDSVKFATNGNRLFHYVSISTSSPFVWCEDAIGPARSSVNEFDVTLYVTGESDTRLLPVPTAVRLTTGASQAEQSLLALLEFENINGYLNPISSGTVLEDLSTQDGNCYVTLSGSILHQTEGMQTAVHAIVATLCSLEDIRTVTLIPAGPVEETLSGFFNQPYVPSISWFS